MPPLTAAVPRLKNSVPTDHRPAALFPDKGVSAFTHNSSLRQTILMHFENFYRISASVHNVSHPASLLPLKKWWNFV
jgi:hypothetical protein